MIFPWFSHDFPTGKTHAPLPDLERLVGARARSVVMDLRRHYLWTSKERDFYGKLSKNSIWFSCDIMGFRAGLCQWNSFVAWIDVDLWTSWWLAWCQPEIHWFIIVLPMKSCNFASFRQTCVGGYAPFSDPPLQHGLEQQPFRRFEGSAVRQTSLNPAISAVERNRTSRTHKARPVPGPRPSARKK